MMMNEDEKLPGADAPLPENDHIGDWEETATPVDQPDPRTRWEAPPTDWREDPPEPPKQRRSLFFPIALILIGGMAIAYNFNLLPTNLWYWLWRLWPVWLIIAGLEIAFGRRKRWIGWIVFGLVITGVSGAIWGGQTFWHQVNSPAIQVGEGESTPVDMPVGDAKEAEVRVSPGIAHLQVDATTDAAKLAEGQVWNPPGLTARTEMNIQGDKAYLTVSQRDTGNNFRFGNLASQPWALHLTPKLPLRLTVDGGVGREDLNLRDLQVTNLDLRMGVGETNITLPQSGKLDVVVDSGVGKVTMWIPRSMGALIRVNSGIGEVSVNGTFERSGNTYQTQGFDKSDNQAHITINGGLGKIEIQLID